MRENPIRILTDQAIVTGSVTTHVRSALAFADDASGMLPTCYESVWLMSWLTP